MVFNTLYQAREKYKINIFMPSAIQIAVHWNTNPHICQDMIRVHLLLFFFILDLIKKRVTLMCCHRLAHRRCALNVWMHRPSKAVIMVMQDCCECWSYVSDHRVVYGSTKNKSDVSNLTMSSLNIILLVI